MFEHLATFPVILVTGPQRSGTRICAKMIAHDTGHRFVDEREIHTDSLYELMQVILYQRKQDEGVVVQCPALCYVVDKFGGKYSMWPDVAVVMVKRSIEDIKASEARVRWEWGFLEAWHYLSPHEQYVAEYKYRFWERWQRDLLGDRGFEVEYESLSAHPLWVPKQERANFDPWQTEVNP